MNAIGEACHRFFAYDDLDYEYSVRLDRADWLLRNWSAPQFAAADLLESSVRLQRFVAERFPGSRIMREWHIYAQANAQLIAGRIDLLLDTPEGFVVFDHKSFPGVIDIDGERLQSFAGQASMYAQALETVTGRPCHQFWLHQPIKATMTRVVLG